MGNSDLYKYLCTNQSNYSVVFGMFLRKAEGSFSQKTSGMHQTLF